MRLFSTIVLLTLCVAHPCVSSAQDISEDTSRKIISKTEVAYPPLARSLSLNGAVKLRVTITPDGKAKNVELVGGNPVFVQAATDAVRKWKWVPGPHETQTVLEIKFERQ